MKKLRPRKLLKLPEVLDRTQLGRSTVYMMISQKSFPKPISLGKRAVAWVEEEIDNWIENKIVSQRREN